MGKYEIHTAKDGRLYFLLKARNGSVICTSQMYASEAGVMNGIASMQLHATTENIVKVEVKQK